MTEVHSSSVVVGVATAVGAGVGEAAGGGVGAAVGAGVATVSGDGTGVAAGMALSAGVQAVNSKSAPSTGIIRFIQILPFHKIFIRFFSSIP